MNARDDYMGLGVCGLILLALPAVVTNDYYLGILVFAALNCLSCVGLSLLMGYAGQVSMGHAAFIAIGAYTSAILTVRVGWSPWAAMAAGVGLSVITALAVGAPSLRLKGHYLAMATLGFGSIVHIVSVAATGFTGGPEGINSIPPLAIAGWKLNTDFRFYYTAWIAVIVGLFLAVNLIHSRVGRGLMAIHGAEDAAAASGIPTAIYKIMIFAVGAVYASISGSLYASYVGYIDPGPFEVMHSVLLVTMVAVGGMHRIWGAVLGSVLLTLLPDGLSLLSDRLSGYGVSYSTDYDMLIYGAILLVIMLFLPEGLMEIPAWFRRRIESRRRAGAPGEAAS